MKVFGFNWRHVQSHGAGTVLSYACCLPFDGVNVGAGCVLSRVAVAQPNG